jgi:hypothetical protein
MRKIQTICILLALLAMWAWGHVPNKPKPSYSVKDFCRDHADVCQRGVRTVLHVTPTPSNKGYVVVYP